MKMTLLVPRWGGRAWVIALVFGALAAGRAAGQQEYSLSYRWEPGQKLSYSVYVVGTIQTTGEPDREVKIRADSVWEVAEADAGTDRFLVIESAKNFVGSDTDLRSFGVPPPDETIQRSLDSFGRVQSVAHYPAGSRYHLLPLTFAPEPVAVGKKWTVAANLHIPLAEKEVDAPAQVEYTLEKVLTHYKSQPGFCALVRFKGSYDYQMSDGSGVSGEWEGKAVFDLTEKIVIDYKIRDRRREWKTGETWSRVSALELTAIEQKMVP